MTGLRGRRVLTFFGNHHRICPIPGSKRRRLVPRDSRSHLTVGWHHRNLVCSTQSCCLPLRFQFSFPRHVKVNVFDQHIYGVSSVHKGVLPRYASRLWSQEKEMLITFYCLCMFQTGEVKGPGRWYNIIASVCFMLGWSGDWSVDTDALLQPASHWWG